MRHKQASFLFSLTMCFLYILYKGIILKKVVGCYRIFLLSFSFFSVCFFGLLAFFSTIVDMISTFSWYNGFILEVFLFFNYFFYPSSSRPNQSHSALKPFMSTSFAFAEIKSGFVVNIPCVGTLTFQKGRRKQQTRVRCYLKLVFSVHHHAFTVWIWNSQESIIEVWAF